MRIISASSGHSWSWCDSRAMILWTSWRLAGSWIEAAMASRSARRRALSSVMTQTILFVFYLQQLLRTGHRSVIKKLGRQSQLLEGALFEGDEVGGRVPAEAGPWRGGAVSSGLGFRAIW